MSSFFSSLESFWRQFSTLMKKQFLLSVRNWKPSLVQIFSPVVICFLLFIFQLISNAVLNREVIYPPEQPWGTLPACTPANVTANCTTIMFFPSVPWVVTLMKEVATQSGLPYDQHFKVWDKGTGFDYKIDLLLAVQWFLDNQNTTQNAIFFKSAYDPMWQGTEMPPDPGYHIFYNTTSQLSTAPLLVKLMGDSILSIKAGVPVHLNLTKRDFPTKFRFSTYNVVAQSGATWFFVPPMISFFVVLTEIVAEKENRLRVGMRMMGLSNTAYWLTWWLSGVCFVTLSTLVLIATGYAFQFDLFTNSNPICLFVLFFAFGMAVTSLSMFISSVIQKTGTAQTVGYALILVGFVLQVILSIPFVNFLWNVDAKAWVVAVRWLLTFYPPFNMAKVFNDIAVKASSTVDVFGGKIDKGPGFWLHDLVEEWDFTDLGIHVISPAPLATIGWMSLSMFFYLFLMFYFDNVLPGEHGSPKPPYFLFMPSYWGFTSAKESLLPANAPSLSGSEADDVQEERRKAEEAAGNGGYPLCIQSISKEYSSFVTCGAGDTRALDGLSLVAEEDSVLCLLGHNGAGKTTLVNILTGLFHPTSGTAKVYGMDIIDEMESIRAILGVCPQHDILWNDLTPREHLELFAKLKGYSTELGKSETDRILSQVALSQVADDRVSSFSGGMKRRLSIGISTIGNPRVIFMDEPTTGLDPVNRRGVWMMIQNMKKGRVIVLTTHNMEEADVLSDKVAILAKGTLRCVGTSVFLKNKFGSGYRVNIISRNGPKLVKKVQQRWPLIALRENDAGSLQFDIPNTMKDSIPDVVNFLETHNDLVNEWGLSQATLEEVFLHVAKESEFGYTKLDDKEENDNFDIALPVGTKYDVDANGDAYSKIELESEPRSYAMRALFRKNFVLQKRQTCSNVCQILTPILVVALLLILQAIFKSELGDDWDKRIVVPGTLPIGLNDPFAFQDLFFGNGTTYPHHEGEHLYHQCQKWFLFSDTGTNISAGILPNTSFTNHSGLLGEIPQYLCGNTTVPYYEPRKNGTEMMLEVFKDLELYNSISIPDLQKEPQRNVMPDGYVEFKSIDPKTFTLSAVVTVNTEPTLFYHRANNFTRANYTLPNLNASVTQQLSLIVNEGWAQMYSMINLAFGNYSLKVNQDNSTANTYNWMTDSLDSAKFLQAMPYYQYFNLLVIRLLETTGTMLYPIALTLQLPVYTFLLVLEKKQKLIEMMKAHGMKMWHYYLVNYTFFFVLYALAAAFFWISGVAGQIRFFSQTNPGVLFVYFFGWGIAMISLAFYLSAFLSDPRAATVVGYALALMGTLTAVSICIGVYGTFAFSLAQTMPVWTFLWPQFSFARATYLIGTRCLGEAGCYGAFSSINKDDELVGCLIGMYMTGICYFLLFLYLDQVLPREYGIAKHPLFFMEGLLKKKEKTRFTMTSTDSSPLLANPGEKENDDIIALREFVAKNGNSGEKFPLLTNELRKVYDDGHVALHGLSLLAKKNSCLGLLGENGAGKTTTISMLTGLFPPTEGNAFVGGYNIVGDIDKVHIVMGLCPQFDILWDDLTCKEHLLFYGRLKGISPSDEEEHAKTLLHEVGLYDARHKMSSQLSGGMKRRLSLAISMAGNSRIIFLDEPTTGLDPASRRRIWEIIARAKQNRAILLTTHGMDEAETLCNEIGILAHGKLRCFGSGQHLRSQYGEGYQLILAFPPEATKQVQKFISSIAPSARLHSKFRGTLEYKIGMGTIKVSDLFAELEKKSKKHGITDWSINQLGLEAVFQRIVSQCKDEGKKSVVPEGLEELFAAEQAGTGGASMYP